LLQQKCGKTARRGKKLRKLTKKNKKLRQFAGHGQSCELVAKRENRGNIAARKMAIFYKD